MEKFCQINLVSYLNIKWQDLVDNTKRSIELKNNLIKS